MRLLDHKDKSHNIGVDENACKLYELISLVSSHRDLLKKTNLSNCSNIT